MNWTQEDLDRRNAELKRTPVAAKPAPKSKRSRMNKWETEYAAVLNDGLRCGIIDWYGFEAINIRLADGARYTPDFAVIRNGVLQFIEVKGHLREAALVRFKVAAEVCPLKFTMLRKKKITEGGGWETMRVLNGGEK